MAMAHSKTKASGGGSDARQVDAPSLEELDELIARRKADGPDISKYISLDSLAKKLNMARRALRYYAHRNGYKVIVLVDDMHKHSNHILLEDAARLVEQRAEEGLL